MLFTLRISLISTISSSNTSHIGSQSNNTSLNITGCFSDYPKIKNCPNDNNFNINIIGSNFGLDLSTILIGSSMCQNIKHISHTNISCQLSGNRGINNVVYVISK